MNTEPANNNYRFKVGDMIEFQKADSRHWVSILDIHEDGTVDAMFWNGLPQYFATTMSDLEALRVLTVERMNKDCVASYRELLAL